MKQHGVQFWERDHQYDLHDINTMINLTVQGVFNQGTVD
jgi:hypothetical protein